MAREGFEIVDEILKEMEETFLDPEKASAVINQVLLQLETMRSVMKAKGEDYSGQGHTWTNFELNAQITDTKIDHVFLHLIGVKFSRQASLLSRSRAPLHESIDDTWIDLVNYLVLFIGYSKWAKS